MTRLSSFCPSGILLRGGDGIILLGSLCRRCGLLEFLESLESLELPLGFREGLEYRRTEPSDDPHEELLDDGEDEREPRLHDERIEWRDTLLGERERGERHRLSGEGERDTGR